jgi:hypothetical protein
MARQRLLVRKLRSSELACSHFRRMGHKVDHNGLLWLRTQSSRTSCCAHQGRRFCHLESLDEDDGVRLSLLLSSWQPLP